MAKLKKSGINVEAIPKKEIETGEGEVIRTHTVWINYLEGLHRRGNETSLAHSKDLYKRIVNWRKEVAEAKKLAPVTVMSEHMVASIAYIAGTSMNPLNDAVLREAGVRIATSELVSVLGTWHHETQPDKITLAVAVESTKGGNVMQFPERVFQPKKPWLHAVYKPMKKTGIASWESSYNRFRAGEHPQVIAMNPENGRPIQVATVIGHVMEALVQGRSLDLVRLTEFSTPPNKIEWDKLQMCEEETINPAEPNFLLGEFLRPVMGDDFATKERTERTPEEQAKFSKWCELAKWYATLKKVDYVPVFS